MELKCSHCNADMIIENDLVYCPKCGHSFLKSFIEKAYKMLFGGGE